MPVKMILLGMRPATTWSYLSMCHHEHILVNGKLPCMTESWNLFSVWATDWLPLWSSLSTFSVSNLGLQHKRADVKHVPYKTAVFKILSIIICDCYLGSSEANEKVSLLQKQHRLAMICPRRDLDGISFLFTLLFTIQKIFLSFHYTRIHGIRYLHERDC